MTRPPHPLSSLLLLALLAACTSTSEVEAPAHAPLTELPPPVVGGGAPSRPRAPVDAADWHLPDRDEAAPPWLRLFFVQDNRGELDACGCPGAPTGGLARRATLGAELRAILPDAVFVEGPNSLTRAVVGIEQIRGDQRARGRQVLDLLAGWAPAAFFPGQADLAVVPLPELGGLARFPVVITNLVQAGAAGTRPSLLVSVGDRRVLLLGLVRPAVSEEARQRLALRDAVEAAGEAVARAGDVDLVVAFTDASLRDQTAWFEAGLDVDVLVTPPPPGQDGASEWRERTLVVRSQPAGRSVQRLDVAFVGPKGRGLLSRSPLELQVAQVARQEERYVQQKELLIELRAQEAAGTDPRVFVPSEAGASVVDPRTDPEAVQRGLAEAKELRARLLAATVASPQPGHVAATLRMTVRAELAEDRAVAAALDDFGARRLQEIARDVDGATAEARYLGHEACVDCHTADQGHWARTAHARAWATLVERGEERNPDCLACHTTGFGAPGGFADPDTARHLVGVQCEACHGPMELHARQARTPGYRPDPGAPVSEATCLRCHDPINSPRFDHATYAPQVAHPGRRRSP